MRVHQHIFEKSSMFNSFLNLQKPLFIKWLGKDIDKLIFGAHILHENVPFLLVSTKHGRQSTKGYAQSSDLSVDRCAS
jgi:hypothetical protein